MELIQENITTETNESLDSQQAELKALRECTNDENLEIVGLDDTFDFECQQCGRCCVGRGDIIINPYDVYVGAKYLGISCEEFICKYTTPDYGRESRIPMVLLASDEKTGYCPLLKYDVKDGGKFKCLVHEAKPGACRNHPIGIVRSSAREKMNELATPDKLSFVKVTQCDNSKGHKTQIVRDWVQKSLDTAEETSYAHLMQTYVENFFPAKLFDFMIVVMALHEVKAPKNDISFIKESQSKIANLKAEFFTAYVSSLYMHYDTNRPFIEQAKENMKMLSGLLKETQYMLYQLCVTMPDDLKEMTKKKLGDKHIFDWMDSVNPDEIEGIDFMKVGDQDD